MTAGQSGPVHGMRGQLSVTAERPVKASALYMRTFYPWDGRPVRASSLYMSGPAVPVTAGQSGPVRPMKGPITASYPCDGRPVRASSLYEGASNSVTAGRPVKASSLFVGASCTCDGRPVRASSPYEGAKHCELSL